MLPKKHLSGAQKRNKRKRENQFIESQKGAIHMFFSTPTNVNCDPSDNPVVDDTHVQSSWPGSLCLLSCTRIQAAGQVNLTKQVNFGWGSGDNVA